MCRLNRFTKNWTVVRVWENENNEGNNEVWDKEWNEWEDIFNDFNDFNVNALALD